MIEFSCPKCSQSMASPDSLVGEAELCPKCNLSVTVPMPAAAVVASAPVTAASAAPAPVVQVHMPMAQVVTAPPLAVVNTDHAEDSLYKASPAMFRNDPIRFLFLVLLSPLFGLTLLLMLLWWLSCKATRFSITPTRSVLTRGILSKHTNEVRHVDVRNIVVNQGFFQRLFGVGSLSIATASQAGVEIKISGIRSPKRAAELIRQHQSS